MTAGELQAFATPAGLKQNSLQEEFSGNLGDSRRLYHWRAPLALRKASCLILIRIDTSKLFPVGVKDTDEVMVMFAATVFAERSLALNSRFTGLSFCHVGHPTRKEYLVHYRRVAGAAQVPVKIVSRTPLHLENVWANMGCSRRGQRKTSLRVPIEPCRALKRHAQSLVPWRRQGATFEPGGTSNVSAFVHRVLRAFARVETPGQFVWKFVARHETFSEFQRL